MSAKAWLGCMLLTTSALAACTAEEVAVPPALHGVWHSSKPGYEENAMEFQRDAVIFSAANDHFTVHPILALRAVREEESQRTRYDLVYSNQGEPLTTSFYHDDRGDLVFENQRGVLWRKAVGSAAAPPP